MRNFLRKMIVACRATGSLLAAMLRRKDYVVSTTSTGFPLLKGWTESPEEAIVTRMLAQRQAAPPPIRAVLFCTRGANPGEVLPLRRNVERLGAAIQNSLVVTPDQSDPGSYFQVELGKRPKLTAETGKTFLLNGNEEREGELYDYDQISLLGNHYLLMDIPTVREAR